MVDIHFCVLGSDGLFNVLSKERVVDIITQGIVDGRTGEEMCEKIVKLAKGYVIEIIVWSVVCYL